VPEDSIQPSRWSLAGEATRRGEISRITIADFPFSVGRGAAHNLLLAFPGVSSTHARLTERADQLWVEDLDSTNGTWVNGVRIATATQLLEGDVVQFGEVAFRVELRRSHLEGLQHSNTQQIREAYPILEQQAQQIDELVRSRHVRTLFQPIVHTKNGVVVGFECLARGDLDGLSKNPEDLFALAAVRNREGELSAVCREVALREITPFLRERLASDLPLPEIFSNVHPREAEQPQFIKSLERLRHEYPDVPLTLEFHERAIFNLADTREMIRLLAQLGIQVAFDEFGAGISRLGELAACPPDILKIGGHLIGLLSASNTRVRRLVASLVGIAKDLGCITAAQGVESQDQFILCRELGFDLAQGYALGRPVEVEDLWVTGRTEQMVSESQDSGPHERSMT
jgi:EAL domain-containing protein (putative c-di-GMP-specific phosphodiesterase class I)